MLSPLPRCSVLFVCRSNVCRSPLASGLFAAAITSATRDTEWRVGSAGLSASPGEPMFDPCRLLLEDRGIRAEGFRSRVVTPVMLAGADVIITMTRSQVRGVLRSEPAALRRTATLNELARCASRTPAGSLPGGADGLRQLLRLTIRDRGPSSPADLSADDIPDPVGPARRLLGQVTDTIEAAVRTLADITCPTAAGRP